MVASVASFGNFNLIPGAMTRAVPPTADAPIPQDRPQPSPAYHSAASVTLAPDAMSALLQAQEGRGATPPRMRTAPKFDRRISRRAAEADESESDEGLFAVRCPPTAPGARA